MFFRVQYVASAFGLIPRWMDEALWQRTLRRRAARERQEAIERFREVAAGALDVIPFDQIQRTRGCLRRWI